MSKQTTRRLDAATLLNGHTQRIWEMSPIDQPARSAPHIRPVGAADRAWIGDFLRERWGATTIIAHGEIIDAAALPALVAEPQRGLATYRPLGGDAELVTLDAVPPGSGTGTALLER